MTTPVPRAICLFCEVIGTGPFLSYKRKSDNTASTTVCGRKFASEESLFCGQNLKSEGLLGDIAEWRPNEIMSTTDRQG